jgi:hypothetical protein
MAKKIHFYCDNNGKKDSLAMQFALENNTTKPTLASCSRKRDYFSFLTMFRQSSPRTVKVSLQFCIM